MVRRETGLSPREREVLALIIDGLSSAEIAKAMNTTVRTARTYVSNVYEKATEFLPIEEDRGAEAIQRRRRQLIEWGKEYLRNNEA
jgi:ATP/maltotriose-dependent transcriptional regulator MalT